MDEESYELSSKSNSRNSDRLVLYNPNQSQSSIHLSAQLKDVSEFDVENDLQDY